MGFTPFGTYWREIRKIATVELFSARRIGMLKPVRHPRIDIQFAYANGGRKALLRKQCSQGGREDGWVNLFRHAIQQFNYHLGNSEMYDALPFMAWLDFKGDAKAMKNTQKDLDYIMRDLVG
ncbi:hypothetical protein Syun_023886 [Stephania yunnanensis]|uniref:Cytochrome P450 n=1 Tax=Stephania yunnanensis TaxID=152371 RepID=A0AAP0F9R5_9MAGN